MRGKEFLIQEWKKNGVEEELLKEYITHSEAVEAEEKLVQQWKSDGIDERYIEDFSFYSEERDELSHCRQSVSVQVPVNDGSGKVRGKLINLPVLPEDADKEHDELLKICLKSICRYAERCGVNIYYIAKYVRNNLPAWSEDLLPDSAFDHIITNHTLRGKIGDLFSTYSYGKFDKKEYDRAKKSIPQKLDSGASLDKTEEAIVQHLLTCDKINLFPRNMSNQQIKKAIRDAYEDARKISGNQFPIRQDIANNCWRGGHVMYRGHIRNLIIHFWFDFEENVITTAYPVFNIRFR